MNRIRLILFTVSTLIFLVPITFGLYTVGQDFKVYYLSEGDILTLPFFTQIFETSYSETTLVDVQLDASGIRIVLEMNLSNPSPFPLTLHNLSFIVSCANHSAILLGSGENTHPLVLAPNATSPIPLTVTITTDGIAHIYTHHLNLAQLRLELTLAITNLEVETSIYTIPMSIIIKDPIEFPFNYTLLNEL